MKKIETTNITGSQDAPFVKDTFDHYNESIADATSALVKGMIGTYTTNDVIVLHGCVVSASIPGTSSITSGAVYYNGEIYEVDANPSIVTTGLQTLVWGIVTTYRGSDPLTWSDGIDRNLHRINKMALSAGLSGSGLANYDANSIINLKPDTYYDKWAGSQPSTGSFALIGDMSYTTPNDGITRYYQVFATVTCALATALFADHGVSVKLINSTDSTDLSSESKPLISNVDITYSVAAHFPVTCIYSGAIAPNKTIQLQGKTSAGSGGNFIVSDMSIVEIYKQ